MEELRPKQGATVSWKNRFIFAVVGFFLLSYLYGVAQEIVGEARTASSGTDVASTILHALIILAVFGGGGGMVLGFFWGQAAAYLRLVDGALEYRWKWWKWEHSRPVDLRTVTAARLEDHVTYYKGRSTTTPSIMFTPKPSAVPLTQQQIDDYEDEFVPLPRGVSPEETHVFLQKVNQEIKRVNGGW